MREFILRERVDCSACRGSGQVEHDAWRLFRVEQRRVPCRATTTGLRAWFRAQGFEQVPPASVACEACAGEGRIEREVPLGEALAALAMGEAA